MGVLCLEERQRYREKEKAAYHVSLCRLCIAQRNHTQSVYIIDLKIYFDNFLHMRTKCFILIINILTQFPKRKKSSHLKKEIFVIQVKMHIGQQWLSESWYQMLSFILSHVTNTQPYKRTYR
jgi:hypothetical protein